MENLDSYIHIYFVTLTCCKQKRKKKSRKFCTLHLDYRTFSCKQMTAMAGSCDSNGVQIAEMDSRQGKAWKTKNDLALNCDGQASQD